MNPIDEQFVRYQRTREASALATVFDRTAPDLVRVARHLASDAADAEDLVQATFLTAIERARRYRAGESVQAWLIGILRNHARTWSRRRRRWRSLGEELESRTSPAVLAEDREFGDAVTRSLPAVPRPYREVVQLRLQLGLSASDIARRLERPAGTVRTQVSRGLTLLRRALPAGLGVAVGAGRARGLAAVRADVLAGVESAAAGATVMWGGAVVSRWVVAAGVAAMIGAGGWLAFGGDGVSVERGEVPLAAVDGSVRTLGQGVVESSAQSSARASSADGAGLAAPAAEREVVSRGEPAEPPPERSSSLEPTIVVVDDAGRPVARAELLFETSDELTGIMRWLPQAHYTDDLGRFGGELPDGCAQVSAYKKGVGFSGAQLVAQRPDTEGPWRIVLRRPVVLRGAVLSADGARVAAAGIRASPRSYGRDLRTSSGADGGFELEVDPTATYDLFAQKDDAQSDGRRLDIRDVTDATLIELRLPGAFSVRGVVCGLSGRPIDGARVELWVREQPESVWHQKSEGRWRAETDASGRFLFALSAGGRYRLRAWHDDLAASDPIDLDLDASHPAEVRTLQLEAFGEIAGFARIDDGRPLVNVRVASVSEVDGASCETTTGPDGAFRLARVPPRGTHTLRCYMDPEQRRAVGVDVPTDFGLDLLCTEGRQGVAEKRGVEVGAFGIEFVVSLDGLATAGIRAVVRAPDGTPVESFDGRVLEYRDGGLGDRNFWADGRAPGTFSIGGIPIGMKVALEVRADGFGLARIPAWHAEAGVRELVVQLEVTGTLRCTVVGAGGVPVARARVDAVDVPPWPHRPERRPVFTDARGEAVIVLPAGPYRVTARDGGRTGEESVEIVSGRSVERRVVLR